MAKIIFFIAKITIIAGMPQLLPPALGTAFS
jgi:hypothetical protein